MFRALALCQSKDDIASHDRFLCLEKRVTVVNIKIGQRDTYCFEHGILVIECQATCS